MCSYVAAGKVQELEQSYVAAGKAQGDLMS